MDLRKHLRSNRCIVATLLFFCSASLAAGQGTVTLEELKTVGAANSRYSKTRANTEVVTEQVADGLARQPNLATFHSDIQPALFEACLHCHDADTQEGNFRIDTLNPDLSRGDDVNWWLEVLAVLTKGEMPPAEEPDLPDEDRSKIVGWLSSEIQTASLLRRAEEGHSSFRRMTSYETNYAMQDLLGLPYDFAKDLPPESTSQDGFQNSSELLHMSSVQFATYRDAALAAIRKAIVLDARPEPIYWSVSMADAAMEAWQSQDEQLAKVRQQFKDNPEALAAELDKLGKRFQHRPSRTYYHDLESGRMAQASWSYGEAKYAWEPSSVESEPPGMGTTVAVIPPRQRLTVELGDRLANQGTMRVRIRASRTTLEGKHIPSLQLEFGWQASNDSAASIRVSSQDMLIVAAPDAPQFYQWDIPLSEVEPRNSMRNIWKMGDLPSPSEFLRFANSSVGSTDVQIDYVEVSAPVYDSWPPESHSQIFFASSSRNDESLYAREVLNRFMHQAWRRKVSESEIDQKLELFRKIRPHCASLEDAVTEVLATVLASPHFLYLSIRDTPQPHSNATALMESNPSVLSHYELATRLSFFLWCSGPDEELLALAADERLHETEIVASQTQRLLADPRSRRFANHFVRQWLGMQLLDYLDIDRDTYPEFDDALHEAMQEEPIAFFHDIMLNNESVLDFIHSDHTIANERLAKHYGIPDVLGNHFRRVSFNPSQKQAASQSHGGLLTQAGVLAMNSDGKDSHPLKRGIWMLENLLNDPPPPPPPAVPVIDLADPEIAKLTLKQRIENHRDQAACRSCHSRIDPWGIALENFDAVGRWRTNVRGQPVEASSELFSGQRIDGVDGLKRYLLAHRQDQFVSALVYKLTTYAIGRPLTFGDRAALDEITAEVRASGDGLGTMISAIVSSKLFQSK